MRLEKGSQDLMQEKVGYSCLKRASEPSAAGREDAGEHAVPCYPQQHLGCSPARGQAPRPPPARPGSCPSGLRGLRAPPAPRANLVALQLGAHRLQTSLLLSLVSCSQSGRTGGRGAPLDGHSPLLCASSLARSQAPQGAGRPSFQHTSWAPVILYPLRSGSLSLLSLSPCPRGIARLLTHLPHLFLSLSFSLSLSL